jgi:D-sedoheptulose 7-phosphate isomerase
MNFPERYQADIVSAIESIDLDKVTEIIELFKQARAQGRNIFVCGNTRIAYAASRVLCDMMMRSSFERPARFRILALDDQTLSSGEGTEGVITERRLAEQLKNFAEPGDIVVGISAPNNSVPVLRALEFAAQIGCKTVAFTGLDGGKLAAQANIAIHVGSTNLGTVEDTHVVICHMIGSYFLEFDRL